MKTTAFEQCSVKSGYKNLFDTVDLAAWSAMLTPIGMVPPELASTVCAIPDRSDGHYFDELLYDCFRKSGVFGIAKCVITAIDKLEYTRTNRMRLVNFYDSECCTYRQENVQEDTKVDSGDASLGFCSSGSKLQVYYREEFNIAVNIAPCTNGNWLVAVELNEPDSGWSGVAAFEVFNK